ncbi:EEF1A lysine methyltransferase 1 [Chelonus insularis]|uniref:EEF1A lysine methyltransferase 1 n=1 Tax=Chelonus insularis TaxID=460826 RepID=UPI001588EF4D|nr:EEF1A lysine methyltransferase 1 [Chelonus insularis]
MTESDDDDEPQLSASTLAALNEFYADQQQKDEQLKQILNNQDDGEPSNIIFDEDWQLSQFWYDDLTVDTIVKAILKITTNNDSIALISCPTLYPSLKKHAEARQVKLFEYDERFSIHQPNFIRYDYKNPLDIPKDMSQGFDLVIADPPFLSEECLEKISETVKFLSKKYIFICTGATMAGLVEKLLNVKKCKFKPQHKNNLANEFWCYANFSFDSLIE